MNSVFPDTRFLQESAALYIHVPFCRSRCGYCSFFTCTVQKRDLQDRWAELLLGEWEHHKPHLGLHGVSTVYFGGGTPSILPLDLWKNILAKLRLDALQKYSPGLKGFATLEANPGTLDRAKLELWQEGGIHRLSMGVQSFDPRVRSLSGRQVTQTEVDQSLRLLQDHWKGPVSFDLICGLPGQSWYSLEADLDRLLTLDPGHLALYEFIQEPGTPLDEAIRAGLEVPCPEERQEWWLELRDRLESAGYVNYEISNFARPGQESLHNLAYWSGRPYLGLGPGAHSFLPSPGGWVRTFQPESLDWPGGAEPWGPPESEVLTKKELVLDLLITGLRTRQGLEKSRFTRLTGLPARWLGEGVPEEHRAFYREDGQWWGLTDQGRDRMDPLLAAYGLRDFE